MIITRAPLRISVGGGGTDLPAYYENNNGTTFSSMAINKYIYVSINKRFYNEIFLRYSKNEKCSSLQSIEHPIIRETLSYLKNDINSIEITSTSDIPSGTGLGSSGTFGVALQAALRQYLNIGSSKDIIAAESTRIEKDILQRPIGLQDQYIASYGGLTEFNVSSNGKVISNKNVISDGLKKTIKDNLLLFFTDFSRDSSSILNFEIQEIKRTKDNEYSNIIEMGKAMYSSLITNNIEEYGSIMHEYWLIKQERQKDFTQENITDVYNHIYGKKLIHGGKLVGAGGSGFLLLCSSKPDDLRQEMKKIGVQELTFDIDESGVTIIE